MSHAHTPAEVLRASFVAAGLGVLRSQQEAGAWPIYVGHMPDDPDAAVCLYDTSGRMDGRVPDETITKPGFQLRVRAGDHRTAYTRIQALQQHLDTIYRRTVAVGGDSYIIQAVRQTSTVLALGREPGGERRTLFTLNGTITYSTAT